MVRRDRTMAVLAVCTIVPRRYVCCDQFAFSGRERVRRVQQHICKLAERLGGFRTKLKQSTDARNSVRQRDMRMILDVGKKCWLHTYRGLHTEKRVGQSYTNRTQQVQTGVLLDPVAAYDRIAPIYALLSERRKPYLDRIDQLILSGMPPGSNSMLDVGSGDGARARRIAHTGGISDLVLLEPSLAMQGNADANAKVWTMRAEELHSVQAEFDVVTCLWNVLGHISPASARIEVLRQFARLVSPQGAIFVEENHRYNARHYGSMQTAVRFLRDIAFWTETNGDVVVAWDVEGTKCTTRGHVFTDKEFRALARTAGLHIEKKFIVDYATGELGHRGWQGNLLYVLRPASGSRRADTGTPR